MLQRQSEIVKNYGVSVSTLHKWSAEGKLTDHRTDGQHRRYDPDEVQKLLTPSVVQTNMDQLVQNVGLLSRSFIASRLGKQFNGARDLYSSFGYVINPVYPDYRALFDRVGIATRAVEILPNDTWRKPPILIDGKERSDGTTIESQFLNDFNELADRLKLWPMLRQADVLCGIGRYSVLFMGAPGDLTSPAGDKSVAYLSAFDESQATIQQWVIDSKDPNYGMPKAYNIAFNMYESGMPTEAGSFLVDRTRVLHIAENKLGSRVFGRPRLQNIINRLFDLEKVTGGSAEAVWLTIFKGMIFSSKDGTELPAAGSPEQEALQSTITDFVNRLQRYVAVDNMDVKDLGVDTINVTGTYDVLTTDLIGSLPGIPKRIFFGAESGHLASTQDFQEYMGTIASRQTNFAEPEILRPFVNWLIEHHVIHPPKSGKFGVWWPALYEMTMTEKAHVALEVGDGAFRATNGAPEQVLAPDEWRSIINLPPMDESIDRTMPGSEIVPTPTGTVGNRPPKDVTGPTVETKPVESPKPEVSKQEKQESYSLFDRLLMAMNLKDKPINQTIHIHPSDPTPVIVENKTSVNPTPVTVEQHTHVEPTPVKFEQHTHVEPTPVTIESKSYNTVNVPKQEVKDTQAEDRKKFLESLKKINGK